MKKRTVGFLLAIVFALTALSGLTSGLAVADDGLVACFDFDSGLVSNGFTASLCGGATVKEDGLHGIPLLVVRKIENGKNLFPRKIAQFE